MSSPHWSTVAIAGRACEVFAPPDPLPGRALVSLHDLRGESLRDCPPLCAAVEEARLPVVAPQAGRCWWLDRPIAGFDAALTPERFVIDRLRPEIEARFGVRPPGIAVIGIGMGGQGALRLAYRHPAVFPVSAAIAPAIDFHRGMREAADRDDGELFDTLKIRKMVPKCVTWVRQGLSVSGPFGCRRLTSPTMLRFHSPLIEPDVQNSRVRLSDQITVRSPTGGTCGRSAPARPSRLP